MPTATLLRDGAADQDRAGAAAGASGESAAAAAASGLPHICFVSPYIWPVFSRDPHIKLVGGAEVQQSTLARLFRRHGYRVSIVCQDFGQPQAVEIDGVTVYKTFKEDAGIPVLRFLHPRLTAVWRTLRAVDADIYYQRSTSMLTGVVAEFCRRYGKRSIYAGASDTDFVPGQELIRFRRDKWLFQRGLARVDRVVVQNAVQQRDCLKHYGREAVLIPSCYELAENSSAGSGDIVLWVARLHTSKRPELLLEIARRLPHRRFVMIGGAAAASENLDGYFQRMREAAAALPNVEFKGFLPLAQVEPWFDRARVFVNTSAFEGMPNTFMQAWARGVPTVATVDVGARLGDEPVNRFVVDAEDAAIEIERLLGDELHWARASALCRRHFRGTHSTTEVLGRYARIFEELHPGPGA